jgi:hypothetical protein
MRYTLLGRTVRAPAPSSLASGTTLTPPAWYGTTAAQIDDHR